MAVSWSATPLVVSPVAESEDGREKNEVRKEEGSEVANDDVEHNDSAIEEVH